MRTFTKRLLITVFAMFTMVSFAQKTVSGTVMDASVGGPLPGANVMVKGTNLGTTTDFDGNFSIPVTEAGEVVISYVGFATQTISFNPGQNLGNISLEADNTLDEVVIVGSGIIDLAEDRKTPVAVSTIRAAEIQEKAVGNVELPEIVKSTPSVYVSGQTGFGDSQMYMRGFDQTNIGVLLNGQPVNGMEDGRVYWSNWAGIADVANGVQVQRGLGSSKLAISSIGGTMNILMKSTDRTEGGFVRVLGGNDSYMKVTAAYDSGINDKGWSFSVLLDHWQAHRKWAKGTFGQGQTYFFSAGYKPNDNHSFNFLVTGAPQMHGNRWSQRLSTIEEDPKFNQHWGYTSDYNSNTGLYTSDIESERTNYYHKPIINFNWDWTISEKSNLSTVGYASFGRGGGTGPRGDGRIRTSERQIDYYAIQQQNLADPDGIGQSGDYFILEDGTEEGNYIRRASINNHSWFGLVSNYNRELSEYLDFNIGVDFRFYRGDHFRQIVDLYGLTGWANDRADGQIVTSTFDINPWSALFDYASEGDRIAYDYSENINYQGGFAQLEYAKDKFSAFFQGSVSNQSYQREGRMYGVGDSEKLNKIGYNLKGGLSYDIANVHTIFGNTGYYSRQPFLDNVFTNIRFSNDLVQPEVDNEDIRAFELGYRFNNGGDFKFGIDFYHTVWDNRVILSSGEVNGIDVNIFERGVKQEHNGFEFDAAYRILDGLVVKGFFSAGSWKYKEIGRTDLYNDETGELIGSTPGEDISGVHVTTAPQVTGGLGVKYDVWGGLSVDANWNYYDRHFINDIDFNENDPIQRSDVGRLDAFSLVDAGLTYDFQLGDNNLIFRGNIYNIFDEITPNQTDVFGYFNTNGMTWNASVKYQF